MRLAGRPTTHLDNVVDVDASGSSSASLSGFFRVLGFVSRSSWFFPSYMDFSYGNSSLLFSEKFIALDYIGNKLGFRDIVASVGSFERDGLGSPFGRLLFR